MFIHTLVPKNPIVTKDAIFYLHGYNVRRYTYKNYQPYIKKSSFLLNHDLLFLVWGDRVKLTKCDTMEWKTYFSNETIVILLFYCNIISYWEKVTSWEKFSHNLNFQIQIVLKILAFQRHWGKNRNDKKQPNFQKFQVEWKISKNWKSPNQ